MGTDGYKALIEGAATLDISPRARLSATGEDRVRLLHAIASMPVEGLDPGEGTEAFFLNPQGKIQAVARIYVGEDEVRLETAAESRARLVEYLESYIIMDDVTLEDVTDATAAIAVEGPQAEAVVERALGLRIPGEAAHAWAAGEGVRAYRSSISGEGLWLEAAPRDQAALVEKVKIAGAVSCSAEELRMGRVERKRPLHGVDYSDKNIPHETQQLSLVSFAKGCYVGQEIVERVRSLGQVNRLLTPVAIKTQEIPTELSIQLDGKEVGTVTSAIQSPRWGDVRGFSLLRREAATPGAALTVGGVPTRILDWS